MKITFKQFTYTIGSFIIFLAVLYYFLNFSLFLSIGLTVLVFIHELGHIIALKILHKKIHGLYFLPFFGAVVVSKESFNNLNDYAFLKYFGPFIGTIGVSLFGLFYLILGDVRLLQLVFIGSIFNLINMIPITFLDGYGVLKGINKKVEWLGIIVVIVVGFFMFKEYILTLNYKIPQSHFSTGTLNILQSTEV
jgi:Zn-dependent protease